MDHFRKTIIVLETLYPNFYRVNRFIERLKNVTVMKRYWEIDTAIVWAE